MRRPSKVAGVARARNGAADKTQARVSAGADGPTIKDAAPTRNERHRFVITTAIAVAGLIAAVVIPVYLASKPSTPEQHLAECRRAHQLPDVIHVPGLNRDNQVFHVDDCSWPPVPGAAPDGYANIDLQLYTIPGSNSSEQFTDVMVVTTRCPAMLMQFKFVDQGTNVQEKPMLLANDQVASGYDGTSAAIPDQLVPQIGPNSDGRLVVLVNDRYALSRLACSNPPDPAH